MFSRNLFEACMKVIPTIRVTDIQLSLRFYTDLLGFTVAGGDIDFGYVGLEKEGERMALSKHGGDGPFGICIYIEVDDVNQVYQILLDKGHDVSSFTGVHRRPIDQTWGMREFYIDDPDGNCIRFGSNL
jgi:catechol 2,3-dioxygenase-like lactoylglutathione lyase family enzyme